MVPTEFGPVRSLNDMPAPRNIIIEFVPVGKFVKVCAICENTGFEVSIVGDPKAAKAELEALAVRKLKYVMAKQDAPSPQRRGIEV